MLPELQRLIDLQEIESRAAEARKRIADAPARIAALDAKLNASKDEVTAAKQALADNQAARRSIEKDHIAAQQQLSKSKEQLMEVKTNHEYHAMQTQIAAGTAEVSRIEELLLIKMLEADEIAARVKKGEAALKADEASIAAERTSIEKDAADAEAILRASTADRAALAPQIERAHLEMFDKVLKGRQGIAVTEAIDGHCSLCHVALRPQVYNTIRRNDSIYQCDHCQRVLYFTGIHQRSAAGHAAANAPSSQHGDPEPASK
jgi:predicted  nucleic acid-binding Zn-ribbon protein